MLGLITRGQSDTCREGNDEFQFEAVLQQETIFLHRHQACLLGVHVGGDFQLTTLSFLSASAGNFEHGTATALRS